MRVHFPPVNRSRSLGGGESGWKGHFLIGAFFEECFSEVWMAALQVQEQEYPLQFKVLFE